MFAVYTQWDDILNDFSLREQIDAYIDLLAFGMFVIDKSTDCLANPAHVRIDVPNLEYRPERKHLLTLQRYKIPRVMVELPIWRRTDPGHG